MTDATEQAWEQGWEGHARSQRARLAALPLEDKIAWLEDAHAVIRHLRAQAGTERTATRPETGVSRHGV